MPRVRSRLLALGAAAVLLIAAAVAVAALRGEDEAPEDLVGNAPPSSTTGSSTPSGEDSRDQATQAQRGVRLKRIARLSAPLYVTAPEGDRRRVFVVEQSGRIRVLAGGRRVRRPFLDISRRITSGGEQGLLSMAFAPDYARSGRFYVYFTDTRGDTRVEEYRRSSRNPNRANRGSRRHVLFADQPYENHNGGLLLFGPDDLLYVGLGDGGSGGDPHNNAQRLGTLLGKILRIDPVNADAGRGRYRIPGSNPLVGRGGRDEIYAYGLRNPWRFSFDRATGDLYIGDVGQNEEEEIDYASRGTARGRNYGWSCFEGTRRYDDSRSCPNPVRPIHTYALSGSNCAVTGGVVVRDPGLPGLAGRYVYGDFCGGQIRSFRVTNGRAVDDRSLGLSVPNLSSFGEDARGRVYVTSLNGPVYRLVAR
jgi:glucose/arabinose dehydrogenase